MTKKFQWEVRWKPYGVKADVVDKFMSEGNARAGFASRQGQLAAGGGKVELVADSGKVLHTVIIPQAIKVNMRAMQG